MKPTAILINTCRGPVVDEMALYKALSDEKIAGAGLDVMVEEPPAPDHPLFSLKNITFTPHSAGPTWDNWTEALPQRLRQHPARAAGRKPIWVVPELRNRDAGGPDMAPHTPQRSERPGGPGALLGNPSGH